MNNEQLCISLVRADSEEKVISLLERAGYWNAAEDWAYFGENENNFATIGNQQSRPEAAIVEKIINSVDAVLMGECLSRKISPSSDKAPKNIADALNTFFGIYNGKLSNLGLSERKKLAEKISFIATGTTSSPCYSLIDQGEGQCPSEFKNTFLSIGKSNKLRIPFVQGKFNMGGTGVFQFCGKRNLQLLVSRRNPNIPSNGSKDHELWGFTIVRREDPAEGIKSSSYKYLAPKGSIITFKANSLPFYPGKYPQPYENPMGFGTLIKLYEYQMTGYKTNILLDLYNRLSLLMPSIALPVRFYERRPGYSAHSYETNLSGLSVRLDEDKSDNLEDNFPTSAKIRVMGQLIRVSIFAFKRESSVNYTRNEGVVFTINGQTHGFLKKSFFSRNAVKMNYLANSLLVMADCSEIDGRAREDLFMNSRDRLRSGDLKAGIERELEELLRTHEGLKELRQKRRSEEIKDKLGESKPLADVIENLLKKSPTLSRLFIKGIRLPNPLKPMSSPPTEDYNGKKFPTYFKLIKPYTIDHPKASAVNRRFRVKFTTDANNDYLDRDYDPGSFSLTCNEVEISDYTIKFWNGTCNLTVTIPGQYKVGDKVKFCSALQDISRAEPFRDEFWIKVCVEDTNGGGNGGKRKKPSKEGDGRGADGLSGIDLPEVLEIRRDDWGQHGFDEGSALKVLDSGENGYDFFINMDNIHLLTELKTNNGIDEKILEARYKYGMVLMGISILNAKNHKGPQDNGDEPDIFGEIETFSRKVSPVLLPMIGGLGSIEVEEVSKVAIIEED
ncbi:MAG: hypothetical protein KQI35_14250 [Bacteroidetes bacterium]|nr:hypothetical protein [Bacteroidota bacterium]